MLCAWRGKPLLYRTIPVCEESPRYLASPNCFEEALTNLAYLRRLPPTDDGVIHELAETESAIAEEREARAGLYWKDPRRRSLGRAISCCPPPSFPIVFIFFLQQWGGQNFVGYYAPPIFANTGYTGTKNSLFILGSVLWAGWWLYTF
ncbi:hypothetical protein B0H13DRAFT_2394845 [Mycena leptocephala]|nr:hypothetical protein B0H13DRAFT_2394845 [Mycena leptocephala]